MLKLSPHSRTFLEENNINLLYLLEDAAAQQDQQTQSQDTEADPASQDQQDPAAQQPQMPPMSIDEIISQSIDAADQKFVQFRLYDKILNLQDLINSVLNISILKKDDHDTLNNFKDYMSILNELIFTLDINAIYQLIGQIEIDLLTFLNGLNEKIIAQKENKDNYTMAEENIQKENIEEE